MQEELRYFSYFATRNSVFLVGIVGVLFSLVVLVLGPIVAPYSPTATDPFHTLQAPSAAHLMGTDSIGMDIFSRVLWSPRTDLVIATLATGLSFLIGTSIGLFAGYFDGAGGVRGFLSQTILRTLDIVQAFPVFIFALALVAALGASTANVVAAVAFANAPVFLRLTRPEVLSVRERRFIEASRSIGNSETRAMIRHVLPNALTPALSNVSITIGWSILLTAGLSFVGAGVKVPTAEWGVMISSGSENMITGEWWPAFFPGVALSITVLSYSLLADGLRQYLDPTKRR